MHILVVQILAGGIISGPKKTCPGSVWNPVPEPPDRVILVRHTFLYTLELPRLSLLKVAAGAAAAANNSSPGSKAQVNSRTQELHQSVQEKPHSDRC